MKELKEVYQAPTEEAALEALESLEGNWGRNIPHPLPRGATTGRSFPPTSSIRLR